MREIRLIIVHCSAVKPSQTSSLRQIDEWHRAQGFHSCGYHYIVRRDGTVEKGRDETVVGSHCQGFNAQSIGICYEGGLDENGTPKDTRTPQQKTTLLTLIKELKTRYPHAQVKGHHDFNPHKACPCFPAATEYGKL
ncbi:MAG: N-acetylmuramoyl-L-alanine amidase [Bacteroidales bacterium]|nr:N-acetylmuramoyl-L-alanine amidase [Bacteroidales bacterium]